MDKVPVTLVTGFLGSGKTTLISHLVIWLRDQNQEVVYIKNEIGDADVDSQVMQGQHIATRELLNGCICCTLVGPFISAINEIVETFHPDRIIIEASGTADPAALALMISGHPQLRRDGVLFVVDVLNFEGFQELTITAQAQTTLTDLIIFNKVELADKERKQQVVGYIRELNTYSPIVEARQGRLEPELVFGLKTQELSDLLSDYAEHEAADHHHDHLISDQLQSFQVTLPTSLNQTQLETALQALPQSIFRVKGLVKLADNSVVIVNRVAQRSDITMADLPAPSTNRLLCIGYRIDELARQTQAAVTERLAST